MKTFNKKALAVVALFICILGCALTASGMLFVGSNTTHVTVQYTVELSQTVNGSQVDLDAYVANNGVSVGNGLNVDFYCSTDSGVTWIYFASAYTDTTGHALTTYAILYNGVYDFKATVSVP